MTTRGLIKATAYYNKIEAWKDWRKLAGQHPELATQFQPPADAGWKRIDNATGKLRKAIEANNADHS